MKLAIDYKIVKITEKDFIVEEEVITEEISDKKVKSNSKSKNIVKETSEDDKFSFTIKVLTYKENMSIMDNSKKEDGELDVLSYAEELFVNSVLEWENILDINDSIIECNIVNKKLIFTFNPEFCQKIIEKSAEKLRIDKKK
jgi:hypothetical protein